MRVGNFSPFTGLALRTSGKYEIVFWIAASTADGAGGRTGSSSSVVLLAAFKSPCVGHC
jgi:hypothetical protein